MKQYDIFNSYGVNITGDIHKIRGIECQDAFRSYICEDRVVLAVADGLGSVKHAKEGAGLAVQSAINMFTSSALTAEYITSNPSSMVEMLFNYLKEKMANFSTSIGCQPQDLSSTLLIVVITRDHTLTFQLGDGNIIKVTDRGAELLPFISPKNAPSNSTYSTANIFEESFSQYTVSVEKNDAPFYILCTDGAQITFEKNPISACLDLKTIFQVYPQDISNELLTDLATLISNGDDTTIAIAGKLCKNFIQLLPKEEQAKIFGVKNIASRKSKKTLRRRMKIYSICYRPQTVSNIKKKVHLPYKRIKYILYLLSSQGLITKLDSGLYIQSHFAT